MTDFDVRLDMTHLLVLVPDTPAILTGRELQVTEPERKTYRGSRTKITTQQQSAYDADTYIESYVSSPFPVRSFTLNRHIYYHDSAALEGFITSLVRSTNYRERLTIKFP